MPPVRCGTLARARPISTPLSVPASIRSLKSPRWPIRNTLSASLPSPAPSDMLKRSRITLRKPSAEQPSGTNTAVTDWLNSLGSARMAGEDGLQPLLVDHVQRFLEAEEQVAGRRVRQVALAFGGGQHRLPIPERARQLRGLRQSARLLAGGDESEAGRQHQSLL